MDDLHVCISSTRSDPVSRPVGPVRHGDHMNDTAVLNDAHMLAVAQIDRITGGLDVDPAIAQALKTIAALTERQAPPTKLCLWCWGNGMVMHRYRVGFLRRRTFDVLTCPNCGGTGQVAA